MASTGCWKCLLRPSIPSPLPLVSSAPFSTSAASLATAKAPQRIPPRKNNASAKTNVRAGTTLRIKKKPFVKPAGRPPMPGERKAVRKRIVLSNTNALEVEGMVDLSKENLAGKEFVGKVLGLPGPVVDQLRTVEAFKITQAWGLFRRPGLLVREENVEIAKLMAEVEEKKSNRRLVLDGDRGTGKSMMMTHALSAAFLKGWIVVNIPEAQELTSAATEYTPIPNTTPTLYSQNTYAANLLAKIGKANNEVLSNLTLSLEHPNSPIPLQSGITLARLAELGARDPDVAWPLFQSFWREITTAGRPPIFIGMDGISYFMQDSAYRNPDFKFIHAHDLALVKHLMDHLSGAAKLPNGGVVIGAMNRSHGPRSLAADLAIIQQEERQAGLLMTKADPFKKYDERSLKVLGNGNVEVMKLKGLSKECARGLMEYWAKSGVLRQAVNEKSVAEKWALAGNGIVGEIEREALRMRI